LKQKQIKLLQTEREG